MWLGLCWENVANFAIFSLGLMQCWGQTQWKVSKDVSFFFCQMKASWKTQWRGWKGTLKDRVTFLWHVISRQPVWWQITAEHILCKKYLHIHTVSTSLLVNYSSIWFANISSSYMNGKTKNVEQFSYLDFWKSKWSYEVKSNKEEAETARLNSGCSTCRGDIVFASISCVSVRAPMLSKTS